MLGQGNYRIAQLMGRGVRVAARAGATQVNYAASMRRKPFHIAVAAPEVSTGKIRVS
jgi:hypothetical protein